MAYYNPLAPIFVPSTGNGTSFGIGIGSLQDDTTGTGNIAVGPSSGNQITTGTNNTIIGQSVASTTLATGSNNILIGTSATQDTASASTSNTLLIGGGSTAVISATGINSTPAVTIPGSLTVTGALAANGGVTGVGGTVGGASTAFTNTGSTLASVTGMSAALSVGTYIIDGYAVVQCAATPGLKLSLAASTIGASTVLMDTWVYSTTTLTAESNITALASNLVSAAVTATAVFFGGTIVVSTAGTLTFQAAQSVSNATVLTIANGSYITATRVA